MDNRILLAITLLTVALVTGCSVDAQLPAAQIAPAKQAASAVPSVSNRGSFPGALPDNTPRVPAREPASALALQQQPTDEVPLTPYGPLQWTDTLGEAITKMRKVEGPAKVEVVLLHRRLPAEQFDGEGRIRQWLKGLISETATYHRQFQRQSPALPRPYYDAGAVIEAAPLPLVGVPFVLKVTFACEPGLIVGDPERVRRQSQEFFGPEIADDVPLVLSQVELLPSGAVSPEAHREIIDTLMEKYGPLRAKNPAGDDLNQPYLNLTFRDSKGNQLDLYPGGRLLYRNGDVHREKGSLAERFREHQHKFDEAQRKARTMRQPNTLNDL